jgi:hypothetical protein
VGICSLLCCAYQLNHFLNPRASIYVANHTSSNPVFPPHTPHTQPPGHLNVQLPAPSHPASAPPVPAPHPPMPLSQVFNLRSAPNTPAVPPHPHQHPARTGPSATGCGVPAPTTLEAGATKQEVMDAILLQEVMAILLAPPRGLS